MEVCGWTGLCTDKPVYGQVFEWTGLCILGLVLKWNDLCMNRYIN